MGKSTIHCDFPITREYHHSSPAVVHLAMVCVIILNTGISFDFEFLSSLVKSRSSYEFAINCGIPHFKTHPVLMKESWISNKLCTSWWINQLNLRSYSFSHGVHQVRVVNADCTWLDTAAYAQIHLMISCLWLKGIPTLTDRRISVVFGYVIAPTWHLVLWYHFYTWRLYPQTDWV